MSRPKSPRQGHRDRQGRGSAECRRCSHSRSCAPRWRGSRSQSGTGTRRCPERTTRAAKYSWWAMVVCVVTDSRSLKSHGEDVLSEEWPQASMHSRGGQRQLARPKTSKKKEDIEYKLSLQGVYQPKAFRYVPLLQSITVCSFAY